MLTIRSLIKGSNFLTMCLFLWTVFRGSQPEVFCKKGVLRNFAKFTGKYLCQSLFFTKASGPRSSTLLKKETLAQVFSSEFRKHFKNTCSYRTPLLAASEQLETLQPMKNTVQQKFY